MKPVNESIFAQALKDLAETLQQREDEGLNRVIEPDGPTLLREIAENLGNENISEMCTKCTAIIDTLGEVRGGMMIDDLGSLQAIEYHLGTLLQNLLCPEDETRIQLAKVLEEKLWLFRQKAEALEAYLR